MDRDEGSRNSYPDSDKAEGKPLEGGCISISISNHIYFIFINILMYSYTQYIVSLLALRVAPSCQCGHRLPTASPGRHIHTLSFEPLIVRVFGLRTFVDSFPSRTSSW